MSTFWGRTFMTGGFADKIPVEVQQQIVTILELFLMKSQQIGREIDYLQVFELTVDRADSKNMQVIKHFQEEPPYTNIIHFVTDTAVTEKIYVISDDYGVEGEVITYLLASEY